MHIYLISTFLHTHNALQEQEKKRKRISYYYTSNTPHNTHNTHYTLPSNTRNRDKLRKMEWRKSYLDVILVPLGFLVCMGYHVWLWHKVRTQPLRTIIGTNANARRLWVSAIMKDNDKKNILAVQTLRNTIMGSTLMATTSILLCSGLAAVISSTYSVKKPLNDAVYGAHGEFMVALKYVTLLLVFLFSFICHSLSIRFINQVNFLINCPPDNTGIVTPDYVSELLEKAFMLNVVGNRLFYAALPLLLWIFGPVLVFLCSVTMVPMLYNLDFVFTSPKGKLGHHENGSCEFETV